jgi:radical SAM superfamily enzyme with C-terminal helix-hairpin-helix motif
MEIYDGNHTFGRQFGSYPIVVGINKRIPLSKFYNVKITNHMLRSITGTVDS